MNEKMSHVLGFCCCEQRIVNSSGLYSSDICALAHHWVDEFVNYLGSYNFVIDNFSGSAQSQISSSVSMHTLTYYSFISFEI